MFLSDMEVGDNCKVVKICAEKEGIVRQMENMGIYPGSDIYVTNKTGSMMSVRAKGSIYALHKSISDIVEVTCGR